MRLENIDGRLINKLNSTNLGTLNNKNKDIKEQNLTDSKEFSKERLQKVVNSIMKYL